MAKVKIQGNASGAGIFTITPPATATDRTLTLPDATGTLVNTAPSTSGNVLTSDGTNWTSAAAAAGGVAGISTSSTSGTAISIDANNIVTYPTRPCFHSYMSTQMMNYGATTLSLAMDTERFDLGADFNTSTYKFTAPVTGKYYFDWLINVNNIDVSAAGANAVYLTTSNRTYTTTSINRTSLSSDNTELWTFPGSMVVDMDSGDTAYIQFHTMGGGLAAQQDYGWASSFTGHLVA
jgi:hypothetical protein